MARHHMINGEKVSFSPEEDLARDASEKAWADGANDRAMAALRVERNRRLAETDFHAMSDRTLADDMKAYRQALRDLPASTDPANPSWPTKP